MGQLYSTYQLLSSPQSPLLPRPTHTPSTPSPSTIPPPPPPLPPGWCGAASGLYCQSTSLLWAATPTWQWQCELHRFLNPCVFDKGARSSIKCCCAATSLSVVARLCACMCGSMCASMQADQLMKAALIMAVHVPPASPSLVMAVAVHISNPPAGAPLSLTHTLYVDALLPHFHPPPTYPACS